MRSRAGVSSPGLAGSVFCSMTPTTLTSVRCEPAPTERRLVTLGQLSVDTIVQLDRSLAAGDQNIGTFSRSPGGTAAIVAHNAAILGGSPTFVGHVGSSPEDGEALGFLRRAGVVAGATTSSVVGLRVEIFVDPAGERTMVSNGARPEWSSLDVRFQPGDIVFFEGWALFEQSGRDGYVQLINRAADAGAIVVLDACSASRAADPRRHAKLLASLPLDVVLANELEAAAFALLQSPPAPVVIVHRGGESTVVLTNSGLHTFAVHAVRPLDTTGAGDTFAAGFLNASCRWSDLSSAIEQGHRAARAVVQVVGPLLPTRPSQIAV
jgi:ribokinase